jgi:hypothetical protein
LKGSEKGIHVVNPNAHLGAFAKSPECIDTSFLGGINTEPFFEIAFPATKNIPSEFAFVAKGSRNRTFENMQEYKLSREKYFGSLLTETFSKSGKVCKVKWKQTSYLVEGEKCERVKAVPILGIVPESWCGAIDGIWRYYSENYDDSPIVVPFVEQGEYKTSCAPSDEIESSLWPIIMER